jgi:hypothetical protein
VKKVKSTSKRIALLVSLLFLIGLPCFAYAHASEGTIETANDTVNVAVNDEQESSYAARLFEASPSGATTQTTTISEQQVPLVMLPYETGWALANLLASLLTVVVSVFLVFSSSLRRNNGERGSEGYGLTVFSMTAAIMTTILFASTEDIQSQMVVFDSLTVVHVALLAVAILCVVLSVKKNARARLSQQ